MPQQSLQHTPTLWRDEQHSDQRRTQKLGRPFGFGSRLGRSRRPRVAQPRLAARAPLRPGGTAWQPGLIRAKRPVQVSRMLRRRRHHLPKQKTAGGAARRPPCLAPPRGVQREVPWSRGLQGATRKGASAGGAFTARWSLGLMRGNIRTLTDRHACSQRHVSSRRHRSSRSHVSSRRHTMPRVFAGRVFRLTDA